MGLSLSSFYYYFFLEGLTLFLILVIRYKFKIFKEILINFKNYVLIFSFLITSFPFLLNLYFHESDFTTRQCVYDLNLENKQILFKFYIIQFKETNFILVLLTIVFSQFGSI